MTSPIIPVGALEPGPSGVLVPARSQQRVPGALVRQQAQLVAVGPAEAGAVGDKSLAAVVERRGALVDGVPDALPGQGRFGEHLFGVEIERGRGGHGRDAEGLEVGAGEARVDKVVAVGDAEDGAVDAPFGCELAGVGVWIQGVFAACRRRRRKRISK